MYFLDYPNVNEVPNAPLIELGFNNGMATGYEKVEELIRKELPNYEEDSKKCLILNGLLTQVNAKKIVENQRIEELESYLKEAVSYNQQKKKPSLLEYLLIHIKKPSYLTHRPKLVSN